MANTYDNANAADFGRNINTPSTGTNLDSSERNVGGNQAGFGESQGRGLGSATGQATYNATGDDFTAGSRNDGSYARGGNEGGFGSTNTAGDSYGSSATTGGYGRAGNEGGFGSTNTAGDSYGSSATTSEYNRAGNEGGFGSTNRHDQYDNNLNSADGTKKPMMEKVKDALPGGNSQSSGHGSNTHHTAGDSAYGSTGRDSYDNNLNSSGTKPTVTQRVQEAVGGDSRHNTSRIGGAGTTGTTYDHNNTTHSNNPLAGSGGNFGTTEPAYGSNTRTDNAYGSTNTTDNTYGSSTTGRTDAYDNSNTAGHKPSLMDKAKDAMGGNKHDNSTANTGYGDNSAYSSTTNTGHQTTTTGAHNTHEKKSLGEKIKEKIPGL